MGLAMDSVIVADNIATIADTAVDREIGTCPIMDAVGNSLRTVLGLGGA